MCMTHVGQENAIALYWQLMNIDIREIIHAQAAAGSQPPWR